ncbi:(Fe-S)-binding protein [Mucilaginibacter rubeus]|jgi:L-lactate dehydrogenase complex protein LldE|uniref:(Fe-S)-binding protein n=1 Tax=Mucilaginibacter rubeus TaxID=2027860 RepID=A0AAE6MI06_9SPHI|nr:MULTISPECIES: (Fe-S)-binding protein [Mucilaginibacter]QEM04190.1 (Fe-S)-binding protein [Mucilaginibacter rubeus]QEM16793.1 (Fe-S)-binding protein [Mucilaginibacter gossypii]QTE46730.1 (Fe-S)-binding protein [Mucilaginibacter rubeus]QTE53327.1 (Fe-S)-binding protein [Mucilaginibacter rubeus]QTE58413.1 (Fe-S)-binding protein [Mucilaginibacter rubeus]
MKVELFIPCFIDQLFPATAFNTVKLLEKAGCKVSYNPAQTCCGQPAFNAGFWDDAKEVGSKFLSDFSEDSVIVSPSASCTGMVKNYYNDLFTNTAVHNKCRAIQGNIYELSDFLVNILEFDYFGAELDGKAVYHDSCAGLRECKIKDEPRQLLSKVLGLELLDLKDGETCCGFGGTFAVKFDGISTAMAQQKVNNALDVGAEYIISTDTSCLMHMQGYIDKNNLPIQTMHIADVLALGWGNV